MGAKSRAKRARRNAHSQVMLSELEGAARFFERHAATIDMSGHPLTPEDFDAAHRLLTAGLPGEGDDLPAS